MLPRIACLWVAAMVAASDAPKEPPAQSKRIIVIAHRGAHRSAPENTLAGFRRAIELGCDYVELDVRRTKDGALVLMHDGSVDRTTTGKGKVTQLALEEIRALDAGVKRGEKWKGEKVPTFDEALALCKGKIKVYVDNKAGPPEEVMAAIEKQDMLREVVIYDSVTRLYAFKKIRPTVWIMPSHPGSVAKITELARDLKPETLDGNLRSWKKEQVEAAHKAGIQVWVDNLGTHDNEAGFQKALDMGVDAIQTDQPEKLLKFLREKGLHN